MVYVHHSLEKLIKFLLECTERFSFLIIVNCLSLLCFALFISELSEEEKYIKDTPKLLIFIHMAVVIDRPLSDERESDTSNENEWKAIVVIKSTDSLHKGQSSCFFSLQSYAVLPSLSIFSIDCFTESYGAIFIMEECQYSYDVFQ